MKKSIFSIVKSYFPVIGFLILFFQFSLTAGAQNLPKGVTSLGKPLGYSYNASFFLEDSKNNLWMGLGGLTYGGGRSNYGLKRYNNGKWITEYSTGIFTDALIDGSTIYFASYDGLYSYVDSSWSLDKSMTELTCITRFKNYLFVGTMGNGLHIKTWVSMTPYPIILDGIPHDSIFCMKEDGNNLWIGTSKGLIRFDGVNFRKFEMPVVQTGNEKIDNNQRLVISVEKDKDKKLWVLTRNTSDSLECLFIFENGTFNPVRKLYDSECFLKKLVPYRAVKLGLNKDGAITLGMPWGILQLSEKIEPIVLSDNIYTLRNMSSRSNTTTYCRYNGNLLTDPDEGITGLGVLEIDTKVYDLDSVFSSQRKTMNTIDINDINAMTANDGTMFNAMDEINLYQGKPTFEIPSLGCAAPMFSSAIWMGGLDESNGNLHIAAQTYRQRGSDYFPGPVDLVTRAFDTAANGFYNKIWKIDRQTIDVFKMEWNDPFYIIPQEILEWPAHGNGNFTSDLAPYVDTDNNGVYEPKKGDYPKIKGDQMLWWVMNDLGFHGETNGRSLGMEIHGSCYAYYHRDLRPTDSDGIVNRTIFFNYKIINRSERNYMDFYTGLFNDVDVGNYADDYIGCDTIENVGFGYNGDNFDQGENGFGKNPPMILCKFLNQKMTNFLYYNNDATIKGNPTQPIHFYKYLRSVFKNDTTYNSIGFVNQGYPCNNHFNDSLGHPGDRRFLMSTNTPLLKKDSVFELEFAYVFLHNPAIDFLKDGCDVPSKTLQKIQNWYNHDSFPSKPYYGLSEMPMENDKADLIIYPNPTTGKINLSGNIENENIKFLEIIDFSGKKLLQIGVSGLTQTLDSNVDLTTLSSGIYLIRMVTQDEVMVRKVLKI